MKHKIEISTIKKLREENKPDELIMKQLGLSPSIYEKYKERIQNQEYKQVENLILGDAAHELLEYVDSLHDVIKECKELGKSGTYFERLEVYKMLLSCHTEIMKIMNNGPTILTNIQVTPAIKKAFNTIEKRAEKIVDIEITPKEDDDKRPTPESGATESNQKK